MQYAAQWLSYQVAVDELIKFEFSGTASNEALVEKHQQLATLKDTIGTSNHITWIKTDDSQLACEGNVNEYYEERKRYVLPKLELDKGQSEAISNYQKVVDELVEQERVLLGKGMDYLDIQNISVRSANDPTYPEIETIKAIKSNLVEVKGAFDNAFAPETNPSVQWQESSLMVRDQTKDFPAFKGVRMDYLFQRRDELHLFGNYSAINQFEEVIEEAAIN